MILAIQRGGQPGFGVTPARPCCPITLRQGERPDEAEKILRA
jgi:hypothetical protein